MKKALTLILAIVMLFSTATGATVLAEAGEPIEINSIAAQYSDAPEAHLKTVVEAFEKEHGNLNR